MEKLLKFQSNLQKASLLNNKIVFRDGDNVIKFSTPTVRDFLEEIDFGVFGGLLSLTLKKVGSASKFGLKASNDAEFILGLTLGSEYSELMQYFFSKYIDNVEFKDKKMFINGIQSSPDTLEFIKEVILISLNKKELPDFEKELKRQKEIEEATGITRKMLEKQIAAERKVEAAKNKQNNKEGSGMSLEKIILGIMVEFKQLTYEEIIDMNFFTISWYFSFIGILDAQQINRIAVGNGLLKKYKYFLK